MRGKVLSELERTEILSKYKNEAVGIESLSKLYGVGKLKIREVIESAGVITKKRGGQITMGVSAEIEKGRSNMYVSTNGMKLIAVCKKTGFRFDDANNLSGCLTTHITKEFGVVPIPTNTYQRKKYELTYGKKWFEEYFDIIEVEDNVRRCNICDWKTLDVENKSGAFVNHLKNSHKITLKDYLIEFPNDSIFHPVHENKLIRNEKLLVESDNVMCLECGVKFFGLTNSHMKFKHNSTIGGYKIKWGENTPIVSINTSNQLTIENNKTMVPRYTSKPQLEIKAFIESLGFLVLNNNKKKLAGMEIDLFIPSKRVAIEYNGIYWHSEKMGKDFRYHLNKTITAENKNIKLIHIFEDEWRDKTDIVKNRIKHLLGVTGIKLYARKCNIKEIDTKIKGEYLNNVHIQGSDSSNIKLGAFYGDKLVGVMTFAKPRKVIGYGNSEVGEYELVRFANDNVVGLGSKMLKYFIKIYNPKKIISYADRRWSPIDNEQIIYRRMGFNFVGETRPNYWYTNNYKNREHRYKYRKNVLVSLGHDPNKTEKEIMIGLGYTRVWDCGSLKYELNLDK